jgi:hypothetical protein
VQSPGVFVIDDFKAADVGVCRPNVTGLRFRLNTARASAKRNGEIIALPHKKTGDIATPGSKIRKCR